MKLSYRNSEYNNELSYLATQESDIKAKYRGSLYQKGVRLEKPELEKKYVWQGAIA
jgi:hypothetical protein